MDTATRADPTTTEPPSSARGLVGVPPADYAGHCRRCGREHRVPNDTALAISALTELFASLADEPSFAGVRAALDESGGKMVGVLVAEGGGSTRVLRAFSGELDGRSEWPGWVGPVLRREDTAELEAVTLARIAELDRGLAECDVAGARQRYEAVVAAIKAEAAIRREQRTERRQQRGLARRAGADGAEIDRLAEQANRADVVARIDENARIDAARRALAEVEARARVLRNARRDASIVLSTAMFDVAMLTNARGERHPLREVFAGDGIPGGVAGCAVPKLLTAANVAGLRPIAMAEAWWGPSANERHHGELQPPCERKCAPILGHLLCGADDR